MSKRHVEELRNVYVHLFEDATCAFPELAAEFQKDLSRLLRSSEERGLPVLVVDLPNIGKHLDRCLDVGQYTRSGLPLTKRFSGRVVIPKFLRGLYLLVFDEQGSLKEDCNVEAVFFLRQILFAAKKAKIPCSSDKVNEAIRDFVSVDGELPIPEMVWESPSATLNDFEQYTGFARSMLLRDRQGILFGSDPELSTFLSVLDKVSSIVTSSLGDYCFRDWKFRHGPGAVSEVTGPSNKYSWRNWHDRLENAFPIADCGYHSYSSWASDAHRFDGEFSDEPSSRLIAVPKTVATPRLIAAEPAAHQWCQQNIWHYLCSRVSSSWIGEFVRFRDQTLNQDLCREASRTADLITVDLSAASDRVTPHLVGQLFRHNKPLLLALQACRTRYITQDIDSRSPSVMALRKFSTMGSACTFPVQTLTFLSVAIACSLISENMRVTKGNILRLKRRVAVFGDDIVAPKSSRDLLYRALELLWFKVNVHKSYGGENFRESCGVDAFRGVSVTPAYWQQPVSRAPESIASTLEVRNNFHRKFLLSTSRYLASTLQQAWPAVAMDSGCVGLKSFVVPDLSGIRTRWNQDLQRMEAYVPTLMSRARRTPTNDDTAILQYFTEAPSSQSFWKHGISQRPTLKVKRRWVPVEDLVDKA